MAPKFVAPYRMGGKRGKNDAADAAAICEAVTRPTMRFVPVKEEHQQIILCLHRARQGFVEERTATYNRLRGLIAEFGIVLPQNACAVASARISKTCPATPINVLATYWPTPTNLTPKLPTTTKPFLKRRVKMRAANA